MTQLELSQSLSDALWASPKNGAAEIYQPGIEKMAKCGSALCDGYTAIGTEWLGFVNRRVHLDLSLAAKLANCSSPQDYMQAWSEFVRTAAEDYRNEFAKLTELNAHAARQATTAAFQPPHKSRNVAYS